MATLRAAPTQPEFPWCLKEGPLNRGEIEPPTPAIPSIKLQQLCKTTIQHTKGMQLTVRATPLTAAHAQDNLVLNLAAMSKALQITNGTRNTMTQDVKRAD